MLLVHRLFIDINLKNASFRRYSVLALAEKRSRSYNILRLNEGCSKEELKSKYLELAKQYHPDVAGNNSCAVRFTELRDAYNFIIEQDFSTPDDKKDLEDVYEFDIRHIAPQHRQYLSYDGIGSGTPSQRQRQHQQYRVDKGTETVSNYVTEKLMREGQHRELIHTKDESSYARRWRVRNAMERLVEDLIQESMRRGDFDNLPGAGKPLKNTQHNPFLDVHTQKLNEILVQNGYCPEWAALEKEIKQERRRLQRSLGHQLIAISTEIEPDCSRQCEQVTVPTLERMLRKAESRDSWQTTIEETKQLNKKIDHFNLICPSLCKQMMHFQMLTEAKKCWKHHCAGLLKVTETTQQLKPEANLSPTPVADDTKGGILRALLKMLVLSHSH